MNVQEGKQSSAVYDPEIKEKGYFLPVVPRRGRKSTLYSWWMSLICDIHRHLFCLLGAWVKRFGLKRFPPRLLCLLLITLVKYHIWKTTSSLFVKTFWVDLSARLLNLQIGTKWTLTECKQRVKSSLRGQNAQREVNVKVSSFVYANNNSVLLL